MINGTPNWKKHKAIYRWYGIVETKGVNVEMKAEERARGNGQEGHNALFPMGSSPSKAERYICPQCYWKRLGGEKRKNEDKREKR